MATSETERASDDVIEALGVIYAVNDRLGTGVIKLFDNRRVTFDSGVAARGIGQLLLRDQVWVRAVGTANDLRATSIGRVPEVTTEMREGGGQPLVMPPDSPNDLGQDSNVPQEERANGSALSNLEGQTEAQQLYARAAVAKAEEQYAEARLLFERAIDLGGGPKVFSAYAKMLIEGRGRDVKRARELLTRAISEFPGNATFYVMFGQMERRAGNLSLAEDIFRAGLRVNSKNTILRTSLAQVLAQIATAASLKEAADIFSGLESDGKLNKRDNSYNRFRALASNPRAGRTYRFLEGIHGFRPGIPGRKDVPSGATDLLVEIADTEFDASFGMSGAYLVRCFSGDPQRSDIISLSRFLRSLKSEATVGLITGRELVVNPSLAFVSIPRTSSVRDYLMSVLAENNEAIVPIDEGMLASSVDAREQMRSQLSQYLGARDLYDSTLPVSGRRLFGREKMLVQLADQVRRGDFIGIFGLRKMGKTSLIYQLRDEKLKDDAVAYVDLQSSPGLSIRSFGPVYWEIERDLLKRLEPKHPKIKKVLRLGQYERYSDIIQSNTNPALIFGEDVRSVLELIQQGELDGVSRLVIVLDELERCLPLAGQPAMDGYIEFFGTLRGLAQTDRFRGLISSVVVAANAAISERAYWEGRENPVFALYKAIFVPPLSRQDTTQMIQSLGKAMSVYWEPEALQSVFDECGGHPFLTRVLCSQLIERHVRRPLQITKRMVAEEMPIFIRDKSDKFQQIVELLHSHFPDEEVLLESLALNPSSVEAANESIPHLLGYQLVRQTEVGYSISISALQSWLLRRAGAGNA